MRTPNEEPPFGIELRERACTHEFGVHHHASTPKVPLGKITSFGRVMNQAFDPLLSSSGLAACRPAYRELAGVRAAKRDAQLASNLARARQLAEEARQLIVGDYARAASAIAETLARLAAIESEVRVLNARLPPDAAYVQIEAFRGHGRRSARR
jgi:hypothetical protein